MAAITSLGVGSGLPLDSLLAQLDSVERTRLEPYAALQKTNNAKISAFGRIKSALSALQDAVTKLNDAKTFRAATASLSGTGLAVAVGPGAGAGTFTVEVSALARAHSVGSTGFASRSDALGSEGTLTIGVGADAPLAITVAAGDSLETIRDAINTQNAGVSAAIVNTGDAATPYRLMLTSKETGVANALSVGFASSGADVAGLATALSDAAGGGTLGELVAADDAALVVNGIGITRASNTIDDALPGVTFSLTQEGPAQTLTIARDDGTIKDQVKGFVDAYNNLDKLVDTLQAYDAGSGRAGELIGNSTLRSLQRQMRESLTTQQAGTFTSLSAVGVSVEKDGSLKIDDKKLSGALGSDAAGVAQLFAGQAYDGGLAGVFRRTIKEYTQFDGIVDDAVKGFRDRNERLGEIQTRLSANIDTQMSLYRKQFSELDRIVSQMTAISNSLNFPSFDYGKQD